MAYLAQTHSDAQSSFLVEPKPPEPVSRPLHMCPAHSKERLSYLKAMYKMHLDLHLADTIDLMTIHEDMNSNKEGESSPLPRYHIKDPEGFDPDMIDKTIPEMREWVHALITHKIKKFTCLEAIGKHTPNPKDPLLRINIKKGASTEHLKRRFIPTPVHMQAHLKEFLESMLSTNMIRKSSAPFGAPVLVIPKPPNPDGTSRGFRLVTDYRQLNKIVEPTQHHIPDVHSMYEKLRRAKYITTLDLKNGYWNAGIREEDKHLTAFTTEFGDYEYNVVPQGLVSSASHFQNWVETKLRRHGILFEHVAIKGSEGGSLRDSELFDEHSRYKGTDPIGIAKLQDEKGFVAVYIDDLIVFSDSIEDNKRHLLKVMQVCSDEGLYLNTKKSHKNQLNLVSPYTWIL